MISICNMANTKEDKTTALRTPYFCRHLFNKKPLKKTSSTTGATITKAIAFKLLAVRVSRSPDHQIRGGASSTHATTKSGETYDSGRKRI